MKKTEKITVEQYTAADIAHRSTIIDIFKAWGGVFKALLGKQKDNEVLNDLGVKKGVGTGFKYMLWLTFVLPPKLLIFVLTPRWEYLRFLERSILTPILEMDFISGEKSPSEMLGKTYEKYVNFLSTTQKTGVESAELKPETSDIERIIAFAKMRAVTSMVLVAAGAAELYDIADELTDLLAGLISTVVSTAAFAATGFFGAGVSALFVAKIVTYFLIAYLLMVFVAFIVEGFRNVAYTRREMVLNFVDDTLNYTVHKSIENFGEDTAMQAYDLLVENYVSETPVKAYVDYNYDRLLNWKERKGLIKPAEAEISFDNEEFEVIEEIKDEK